MVKTIWFRYNKKGWVIPVYFRKGYKKARVKKQSERWIPGFWKNYVKGDFLKDDN